MKKVLLVMLMVGVLFSPACEGPEGPQGPPGFDGRDGVDGEDGEDGLDVIDLVFEAEVDFTEESGYAAVFDFGDGVFADDGFLVFRRFGVIPNEEGGGQPIWRLLPQTIFLENGVLVYNYEFTNQIVAVFIDGAVDPTTLPAEFTQNQYFRIVYMPGLFAQGEEAKMDYSDFGAVMKMIGKREQDIVKIKAK